MLGKPVCPVCGGDVMPIAYGLPGHELVEAAERGEVVLGGCCIWDDNPTWQCGRCGERWGSPAIPGSVS